MGGGGPWRPICFVHFAEIQGRSDRAGAGGGSANSAEYRAGLTVPGAGGGIANSGEYRAGLVR